MTIKRGRGATYLGDGVYVDITQFGAIRLTAEDGIRVTNTIFLEPEVLKAFLEWLERNGPCGPADTR
ncbi:MAG: hypothetical protein ACRD1R_18255 [Acidobacteriota bacterium]